MGLHKNAQPGDIHVVYEFTYASQVEREAATGFIDSDLNKLALQTDNKSLWLLFGHSPTVWNQVSGSVEYPELSSVQLDKNLANPPHSEALMFYDKDKNAVSYYNEESNVTVNLGQEILIPVYNNLGEDIPNGTIVYPTGVDITSGKVTIGLADAHIKSKCRLVGMATHSIEDGTSGYVTRLGEVGGLDTSLLSGILYLSSTVPGAYVMDKPDDGSYVIAIGAVGTQNSENGTIILDPNISHLTVEVTDTNGFPPDQKSQTTLAVNEGLLTFSITPSDPAFHFYELGDKFEIIGADSVIFDDLEGEHWFFYENGVLIVEHEPIFARKEEVVLKYAFVATLYWNAVDKQVEIDILDERHGISMNPQTHLYLHNTRGAQFISGYGLGDFSTNGSGVDLDVQFSIASGTYVDEDITHIFAGKTHPAEIPVVYNLGTDALIRTAINTGFSIHWNPAGSLYYNEWTGTAWQLTEVPERDFCLYHIFGMNGISEGVVSVMGQAVYETISSARSGANIEISNLLSSFPFAEMISIGTIILEKQNAFANAANARIVTTDTGQDYIDWRTTELAKGTAPSSHTNLTNVNVAATNEAQGHIDNSKPLQLPELTTTERDAIASPKNGMVLHNITTNEFNFYKNGAWETQTVEYTNDLSIDIFMGLLPRNSEINIHGGLKLLGSGPLSTGTNIELTKGTGKVVIALLAGSDFTGEITITGTKVDRNTGVETVGFTDIISVDGLSIDSGGTDGDGFAFHDLQDIYLSSVWFKGTIIISTTDVTLTSVDVYHCSFEQFNSEPQVVVNSLDINIYSVNTGNTFTARGYTVLNTNGSKFSIQNANTLNISSSLSGEYYRLRSLGGVAIDGTNEGVFVDTFATGATDSWTDFGLKIWITTTKTATVNS